LFYVLLPMLSTLPFALTYSDDVNSGYIKNIITHEKKESYLVAKFIIVFISGFITIFFILATSLLLATIFLPAMPPISATQLFSPQIGDEMLYDIFVCNTLVYILIYTIIDSMYGGLFAVLALLVSIFSNNTITVFAMVSAIYIFTQYICGVFKVLEYSPMSFLVQNQLSVNADIKIIILEFVIVVILSFVSFILVEGKKDVY